MTQTGTPTLVACLVITVGLLAVAGLLHGLSRPAAVRARIGVVGGLGVPFIGTVSALFALFTGFVANEAWDRQGRVARAVLAERDALVAVHELSLATASDMGAVRDRLRAYAGSVLADEWPAMGQGASSEATGRALTDMLGAAVDPAHTGGSGAVAHAELVRQAMAVRAARSDRLTLATGGANASKWLAVVALAVLTQVGLALIHLDRLATQAVALAVFSLAAAAALCCVAAADLPYGPERIDPGPIERALAGFAEATPAAPPGR